MALQVNTMRVSTLIIYLSVDLQMSSGLEPLFTFSYMGGGHGPLSRSATQEKN
jgi:hypothetical protein